MAHPILFLADRLRAYKVIEGDDLAVTWSQKKRGIGFNCLAAMFPLSYAYYSIDWTSEVAGDVLWNQF